MAPGAIGAASYGWAQVEEWDVPVIQSEADVRPRNADEVALANFEKGLARLESRQVFGKIIVHF